MVGWRYRGTSGGGKKDGEMIDPGGVPGLSFQGFGDGEAQVWSIFTQREGCGGLRVCLPMQGTWVRALVWEDPKIGRAHV